MSKFQQVEMRRGGECLEAQETALPGSGAESVWLGKNCAGAVRGSSVRLGATWGSQRAGQHLSR